MKLHEEVIALGKSDLEILSTALKEYAKTEKQVISDIANEYYEESEDEEWDEEDDDSSDSEFDFNEEASIRDSAYVEWEMAVAAMDRRLSGSVDLYDISDVLDKAADKVDAFFDTPEELEEAWDYFINAVNETAGAIDLLIDKK